MWVDCRCGDSSGACASFGESFVDGVDFATLLAVIAVVASFGALWFLSCRGDVRPAGCVLVLNGRSVPGCCSHSCSSLVGDVSWSVSLSLLVPQSSELVPWVGV